MDKNYSRNMRPKRSPVQQNKNKLKLIIHQLRKDYINKELNVHQSCST